MFSCVTCGFVAPGVCASGYSAVAPVRCAGGVSFPAVGWPDLSHAHPPMPTIPTTTASIPTRFRMSPPIPAPPREASTVRSEAGPVPGGGAARRGPAEHRAATSCRRGARVVTRFQLRLDLADAEDER